MKAVAYCRKSTSGFDKDGIERQEGSFDRQRDSIEDYAKRNGIQIGKWYEDEASGKSIRKRKQFLQMVKDANAGKFKIILFGEYDRFMRNVHEAWRYELELKDAGVKLHFSNLRNDGCDAEESYKDMFRRMAANFSRELARKSLQGMVRKAKMGSWLGGLPPYGYRSKKNVDGTVGLIVEAKEAKIVELIFKLSLKGWGHKKIATILNGKGIPSSETARARNGASNQNPDGRWPSSSVMSILRNPIYKGVYRWNRRARVDCFDWKVEGRGTVEIGDFRNELDRFKKENARSRFDVYADLQKPKTEWIEKEGAVPAIIPLEIFDRVQERFCKHSSRTWQRRNTAKYLMSGALKCSICGNRFHGHRYNKVIKDTGLKTFYEYYRCGGDVLKGSHGKSAQPMLKRETIDRVVIDGVLERANGLVDFSRVRELFKEKVRDFVTSRPNRLSEVELELEKVEREIGRTIDIYTKFEKAVPEEKICELNARKKVLISERARLIEAGETNFKFDVDQEAKEFVSSMRDVESVLTSGDPQERIDIRLKFLKGAEVEWPEGSSAPEVVFKWYKIPHEISNLREVLPRASSIVLVSRPDRFALRSVAK